MSRWMENKKDENGKTIYVETLKDESGCSYEINEVCCNADCEMCADFPPQWYCKECRLFTPERPDEIEALRKGIISE